MIEDTENHQHYYDSQEDGFWFCKCGDKKKFTPPLDSLDEEFDRLTSPVVEYDRERPLHEELGVPTGREKKTIRLLAPSPKVRAFMHFVHDRAYEAGKEQGIRNVGKWYKLPVYTDFNGSCNVCGGLPVKIRGRNPKEPERKICPTCAQETVEGIFESCNNRDACESISSKDT